MASGAFRDLTNGALNAWWAQLKLKMGDSPPDDENDGIKLMGYNTYDFCMPTDGRLPEDACDAYGKAPGGIQELPNLRILDEFGSFIGVLNYKTPDSAVETITYQFAIVTGIYTGGAPQPYDIAIDAVSLIDSVAALEPSAVGTNDMDNGVNLINYPNPFNGLTTISYNVKETSDINLSVYNVLGEEVACLYNGKKEQGKHTASFDATNAGSSLLFCKLQINDRVIIRKMSLLR
jgi:hypothetical protein